MFSGKTLKVVGISLVGALLIIGVLALAVRLVLSPERVKALAIPLLEERLGGKVGIDKIRVSLFSGIEITNLSLSNAAGFSPGPLFAAKRLTLKYRLLPLIARKVVIESVEISEPAILIEQKSPGRYNFAELGKTSPRGSARTSPLPPKQRLSFVVSVDHLSLDNGKVNFQIYRDKEEKPSRLDLDKVRIDLKNISKSGPLGIDGTVALAGKADSRVGIKGEFDLANGLSTIVLKGTSLPIEQFYSFVVASKSRQIQGGTMGMEIKLSGREFFREISSQGALKVAELGLSAFPKRLNIALEYDATFKYPPAASGADLPKVAQRSRSPFQGEVNIKNLVLEFSPPEGSRDLKPNIKARLIFNQDSLEARELSLRLGQSQLSGSARLRGYMEKDKELEFTLRSNLLDLEELTSQFPKRKAAEEEKGVQADRTGDRTEKKDRSEVAPGPDFKNFQLAGKLEAATVRYKTLLLEELRANLNLRQNLLKEEMSLRLAGGSLTTRGAMTLSDPAWPYQGEVHMQGVKIAPLVQALLPRYAYLKEGKLSAEMRLAGQGMELDEIKNNLWAAGEVLVSDGKVDLTDLLKGYQQYFKLDRLNAFNFRTLRSSLELQKGTLYLKQTNLESADLQFSGKGEIGLVTQQINYNLEVTLSPLFIREALGPLALVPLLRDEQSFITFPLQIRGPLSSPKVRLGIRPEDIVKRLRPKKKGAEEILDTLQKLFSR